MQGAAQRPWNASDDLADDFEPSAEPRRVLVIEDDDEDAMIVSDLLLEAWPTLGIARASALGEAERALGADIDCVLVDLGLPDAYGLEAVQRLREADPEMPVVVLTGDSDEQRGIQALGAGAQDYLIKGTISGASLARAIRHSVQRKLAERFQRELAVLRVQSAENARVQRGLVPHPLVDDPHVSVVSAYRPGNRRQVLGGDFFDVVQSCPGPPARADRRRVRPRARRGDAWRRAPHRVADADPRGRSAAVADRDARPPVGAGAARGSHLHNARLAQHRPR